MNTYLNPDAIQDRSIEPIKLNSAIIEVTYAELKALRDNVQLIPGQQYRITDYVTSTTQSDTTSANHQFDIIVTADSESTLNEVARAIQHDSDTYFANSDLSAWKIWYCLDNDTERFAWADNSTVQWYSRIIANYIVDQGGTRAYSLDKEPYIYDYGTMPHPDTGEDTLVFYTQNPIYYEEAGADYTDIYFYNGITTVDGVEYDSWKKFDGGNVYWVNSESDGEGLYALTERVIYNGQFVWPDKTSIENGKGVIYNMIDEYGNECPYDFKNIMFKYDGLATNVYTFTWIDESYNVMDTSVFGNNGTLTYEGEIRGVYGNVIKPYMEIMYDEDSGEYIGTKQSLNNITFISDYEFEGVGNEGFHGCYGNSFGNDCYGNSFGNDCYGNSFGYGCNSNSFGNGCNSNSFGNNCYNNSFGNKCYNNSFGYGCYGNSFENNCDYNSFGNNCSYNSFGNGCYSNPFGNKCYNNSFGNDCYGNSFGNNCNNNSFGNNCYGNSVGNNCLGNSFGNECSSNAFGNYCSYNSFGNSCYGNSFRVGSSSAYDLRDCCNLNKFCDGCNNVTLWNSTTASSTNCLQSVNVNLIVYVGSTSTPLYFAEICILRSTRPINVYYNGYTTLAVDYGEKWRHITSSTTLTKDDKHIICDNTSAITITLPTGWNGAEYYIHKRCSTSITNTIKTTGNQYISYGAESSTSEQRATSSASQALGTSKLIWDPSATEWIRIYLG